MRELLAWLLGRFWPVFVIIGAVLLVGSIGWLAWDTYRTVTDPTVTEVGTVVEIRPLPAGAFNESNRTQVVTDRGTFVVLGFASGTRSGDQAFIRGGRLWLPQINGGWQGWMLDNTGP
jgi:hypothetical protein